MIKKLVFFVVSLLTLCAPLTVAAQIATHGGGTGLVDISQGSIPFGSVFNLRLATSSGLQFNNTTARLSFTYGSSTALSADTVCISTDCRTSWPTGAFPFTPTSYGNSTSTVIGFLAGLFSVGSTTVNGNLFLTPLATPAGAFLAVNPSGQVIATTTPSAGGSGTVTNIATTYPVLGGPITTTGTISLAFGTTTSNTWANTQTFTNPIIDGTLSGLIAGNSGTTYAAATTTRVYSGPFVITGTLGAQVGGTNSTVAWTGLATTSQPSSSNVLTSDGLAGVYGTATSTLSATSPLTGSFTQLGSGGSIGCQTASAAQAGCLSASSFALFNGKVGTSSGETKGQLSYWTSTNGTPATQGSVATGTVSNSGAITVTAGQSVIGSGLTIGCTTASSGVAGCLSSSAFDTFNGKQAALSTPTWPVILTGTVLSYGGLGTSTPAVQGNIPYFSGVNTFANVATTSIGCTGFISCTGFTALGAASTIGITGQLGIANGGTGVASFTSSQLLYGNSTNALSSVATSSTGALGAIVALDAAIGHSAIPYASSTAMSFSSSLVGTRASLTGALSPIHNLTTGTGTSTTWTASTTASGASSIIPLPFAGTIQSAQCIPYIGASAGSFIGVNTIVNGSNATPSYFVASSTVGTITFSSGNTFTKGQTLVVNYGTTTTATATSISCTFLVTETP